MFKLKKIRQTDPTRFIGITFHYSNESYLITGYGIHEGSGEPCFFLDGLQTRRVEEVNFHRNIMEGKFKIGKMDKNVGV